MDIINLVLLLVLIGVGLYLLNTYVPMALPIKTLINVVVIASVFVVVEKLFGFSGYYLDPHVR